MNAPDLSLVLPMRDEEPVLDELLSRLEPALAPLGSFEIICVDDGSSDGTWERLRAASAARAWLRGVRLARGVGQHRATFAGLHAARAPVVLTMDADLQVFPEDIPLLVDAIRAGADVAFGRRLHRGEGLLRAAGVRVRAFAARVSCGRPPAGVSTFLAVRREILERALAVRRARPVTSFHLMLGEPRRVVCVDVREAPRPKGRSKYGALRLAGLTTRILLGYAPVAEAAAAASALALVAGVFAAETCFGGVWPGEGKGALAVIGALALVELAALGVLGAAFVSRARDARGEPLYSVTETF